MADFGPKSVQNSGISKKQTQISLKKLQNLILGQKRSKIAILTDCARGILMFTSGFIVSIRKYLMLVPFSMNNKKIKTLMITVRLCSNVIFKAHII